ncbi:MAG: glycosyltransferase N-terminal domain-containing protein [Candidatus Marinimicrobia bacterium]|nr:glycosyltransferase N-terminal domain-containing protein [Candidatus Neomarinimicrobiota bacterium]
MKLLWMIIYNGILYPLIFFFALIASIFSKKIRDSMVGRYRAPSILKEYFKEKGSNSKIYWFHASSLGEFYQIKTILEGLKEGQDDLVCIVSFSSPSGFDNAESDAMDLKFYIPFDFPWTVRGILNTVGPEKIVFASYDLWPNLVWISRARGIHINLFSVRIKKGSLKLRVLIKGVFRVIYSSVSSIYTISEKDMKGLCDILGDAQGPRLRVMGNPRYDLVMRDAIQFRDQDVGDMKDRDLRIIIGSAHREEEEHLISAMVDLMNTYPDLRVLYALHEPSESAISEIKKKFHDQGHVGTVFRKKTELALPSDRLVILGVVGILSKLYWQCKIAYIGGGHSTGVHNVMEPAVARLPVLFGPRYHNSHEAEELMANGGGFCVRDKDELLSTTKKLISDEKYCKITSLAASDVIYKNVGSTSEMVRYVLSD